MKRKLVIVLLLGMALEVAGLFGGMEFLREKAPTSPVGRFSQQVKEVRSLVEKAREALKADQLTPDALSKTAASLGLGDPSRNPFALPSGVRPVNQPTKAAANIGPPGEAGVADGKDGTRAPGPKPPASELSGILVGARDRVAIINGTLVRSGDSIEGERVIDIRRDHVVLARDGQRRTLRLPPPFPESAEGTEQLEIRSSAGGVQPEGSNGATKP